jgi:hypothetical protein
MGMITTLVNVFQVQGGHFSSTAKITTAVTGVLGGCMLALYAMYSYILNQIMVREDSITA